MITLRPVESGHGEGGEIDRQVEQVGRLNSAWHRKDAASDRKRSPLLNSAWHGKDAPDGVEIATIAERPELFEAANPRAVQGWSDFATAEAVTVFLENCW